VPTAAALAELEALDLDDLHAGLAHLRDRERVALVGDDHARLQGDDVVAIVPLLPLLLVLVATGLHDLQVADTERVRHGGDEVRVGADVKVGRAQVETPPTSTPVRRDFEAAWTGQVMLGDYPRTVTITVVNHAGAAATATFKVVGKQVTDLAVDLVVEEGEFLRVESSANRVTFEGRFVKDRDEIGGSVALGAFELPLVLRRVQGSAS